MKAVGVAGCIVYAGDGFSKGVLHLLQASEIAAYCLPEREGLACSRHTRELDHMLAIHFEWWDVLVSHRSVFDLEEWRSESTD